MNKYFLWMNGEFIHPEQVPSNFLDSDDNLEISLVEDIRCYETDTGPAVFRLAEHIRQFLNASRALGFDTQISEEELCETVHRTLMFNKIRDGNIRALLLVKKNRDGWVPYPFEGDNAIILAVTPPDSADHPETGRSEADERFGVMLGNDVPKRATLFLVKNKRIHTPPSRMFGNSLVRKSVITLARDLGYVVEEKPISREEIIRADEVFLSTVVGEVQFISEFSSHPIGDRSAGPVTRSLQTAFYSTMQGRGKRSREWLDWVGATFIGL